MDDRKRYRPALLSVGMVVSGLFGAILLLALAVAPFDIGEYAVHDEPVSGPEFLRRAGWMFGALGGVLLFISYTLARHDPDARPLMITFWLLMGVITTVLPLIRSADGEFSITWIFALLIAVWYLYFKRDVAEYFNGLKAPRPNPLDMGDRNLMSR